MLEYFRLYLSCPIALEGSGDDKALYVYDGSMMKSLSESCKIGDLANWGDLMAIF